VPLNDEVRRFIVPGPPPVQLYNPPVPETVVPPDIHTLLRFSTQPRVEAESTAE